MRLVASERRVSADRIWRSLGRMTEEMTWLCLETLTSESTSRHSHRRGSYKVEALQGPATRYLTLTEFCKNDRIRQC